MMAIGSRRFVQIMRLCGLRKSFEAGTEEDVEGALRMAARDELVVVSASVLAISPLLAARHNVVSMPDRLEEFSDLEDLNSIIVSAVGSGFELEED